MSGPTRETPPIIYPVNQRFILSLAENSNIRSRGELHRFSTLCSTEARITYKFSHLSFGNITVLNSWLVFDNKFMY